MHRRSPGSRTCTCSRGTRKSWRSTRLGRPGQQRPTPFRHQQRLKRFLHSSRDRPTCPCIICIDYGDRDQLDAIDRNTVKYGWSVVQIPEDDLGPGWAFTVGLWHSLRQPELAIFGLEMDTMKACLNVLGEQTTGGWPPEPDHERSHVIDGDPVLFTTIEPRWYKAFFGTAIAFYRRPPIPFLQVLWTDRGERFPTDPRCDPAVRDQQPRLWLRPDQHPQGVWTEDL